jgi:tRNA-splicing ligase RtcB
MKLIENIPVFGDPVDMGAFEQIQNAARTGAAHVALMADHHLGYGVPIGGVVAYDELISPSGVGYDIACGNKAVRLDADANFVRANIQKIMDAVFKQISFGVGRVNDSEDVDHALFDDDAWKLPAMKFSSHGKSLKDKAREQLGTVGSGNHYVDVFVDDKDRIWVGVHFGSRGLGHGIATHYIDVAKNAGHIYEGITTLHERSDAGAEYIECMRVAGEYAYAGRDWVCERVAKIIGAKIVEEVHNHHNFAWKENHFGRDMWVVRKGATPAFPGQKGFVGASMAEQAVIIEGVANDMSEHSLYSTVHGAGRTMSRTKAVGNKKKGVAGLVSQQEMFDSVRAANVVLKGAGVDESMFCYKRLNEVLAHHEGTIRVLHYLTPLGVAMAGPDIRDPYKD